MEDLTGKKIKGYELISCIGAGGFGAVYLAHQDTIGREVAIKIILPRYANEPDFIRRFETEAQVIARLEHPHIVPLHDYWRDPSGAYLVMRYLRGGSLRDALKVSTFTPESVLDLLEQVAGALSLAHRNNIIHRDIKPGNILLDEDGNCYLADFGIAKDLTQHHSNITRAGTIVGSLDYISPEQARSEPVTSRTDIYSLGVVVYELLTGTHPFAEVSSVERLYKHINDPLPEIDSLASDIADNINDVIQQATAKNPDDRYQDVMDFLSAYRDAIFGQDTNFKEFDDVILLTPREQEVLSLMVEGLSNRDIADRLVITVGTVKWYITQIYRKLRVKGRVQAIVRAREMNLVFDGQPGELGGPVSTGGYLAQLDNPYKGLEAFSQADSQDYFGREDLINALLGRMAEDGAYGRFLAVVGPSGSGKSSLVKAGLIPALWCGGLPDSESWYLADMLPGSRPIDELEIALTRFASSDVATVLGEHLHRDENGLVRAGQLILPDDGSELVVIVDQFEELFTLVEDDAIRVRFLNLLRAAVTDRRSRVRVIITLRADFYDRPLHYPEFGEMVRHRMETILPLSSSGIERAIVKPAERVGVVFEDGLVTQIVSGMTYQPGALPLLQYCLTELFERREGRILTQKAYHEMGGAVGALAKRAEDIYTDLDPAAKQLVRQMFMRLVTPGEGTEDTRRRVMQKELLAISEQREVMEEVIDLFARYRLLSLDHDATTRQPTVEVAHEAILREWERLKLWLNESWNDIRLHRKLMQSVDEWLQSGQDESYLLQGTRLDEFERWRSNTLVVLTPAEQDYLSMCNLARQRRTEAEQQRRAHEARLEKRNQRILQFLVVVLLFVAIGSVGVTLFAINERNRTNNALKVAEREAGVNHSLVLASNARDTYASGYVDLALRLGLEAVSIDDPPADTIQTLTDIALGAGTRMILDDYPDFVSALSFSPDGNRLLAVACARRAEDDSCIESRFYLHDARNGNLIDTFDGYTGWINRIEFNPANPGQVVTSSDDGSLLIWNIDTGEIIHQLTGHTGAVNDALFVHDGQHVLSASADMTLILWDTETGQMLHQFEGHEDTVYSVDISPDGLSAISASGDTTIKQWNIDSESDDFGMIQQVYQGHTYDVYEARFVNPGDGSTAILSRSEDLMYILWNVETGEPDWSLVIGNGLAYFDVSPDGQTIMDQGDLLWDLADRGQHGQLLHGYNPDTSVLAIDFNPDNTLIATADADHTVRLWNISDRGEIRRYDFDESVTSVVTDGRHLLVGGNSVYLVDIVSGDVVYSMGTNGPQPGALALSGDSRYVLVGHGDRANPLENDDIRLWDLETGAMVSEFNGSRFGLRSVALSPDARFAIAGSQGQIEGQDYLPGEAGDLFLYDARTGEIFHEFDTSADSAGLRFNADASLALSCSAATPPDFIGTAYVHLWDVASGELIRDFTAFPSDATGIIDCMFGPGETSVLAGSISGQIYELDIETGDLVRVLSGHNYAIFSIDISPDGQYIASGSADLTAILWDYETGAVIRRFEGHAGWVVDVAFHPDGNSLFTAGLEGTVRQWQVSDWSLDDLLAWIDVNRYVPSLTCAERDSYHIEPYCETDD